MDSAGLHSVQTNSEGVTKAPLKRKAQSVADPTGPAQKKRKGLSRARAQPRGKTEVAPEEAALPAEPLPQPAGETPAYSNFRAAICASLQFFRSHDSGVHSTDCIATGILLNGKTTARDVLQSQVIVTTMYDTKP